MCEKFTSGKLSFDYHFETFDFLDDLI